MGRPPAITQFKRLSMKNIKHRRNFLILTVFLLINILNACFIPWTEDEANVTLYMGGNIASSRAAYGDYNPGSGPDSATLADLDYTVDFSGPLGNDTFSGHGGTTITARVKPGQWTIAVTARLQGILYAEGSVTVKIKQGDNTVSVPMHMNSGYTNIFYTVTFNSNGGSSVSPKNGVKQGSTISAPAIPDKTGYDCIFDGWYKESSLTTQWNFTNDTVTSNTTLYAKWVEYNIGDTGPGGGKIFYRLNTGFTMTDNGQICHYLEAAPDDIGPRVWAINPSPSRQNYITDALGTLIGTGRKNTAAILAYAGASAATDVPAAYSCAVSYNAGGIKTDWFLPSKDELNELYVQSSFFTNLTTSYYWSSSQHTTIAWSAMNQNLGNGRQLDYFKDTAYSVRAIRAF